MGNYVRLEKKDRWAVMVLDDAATMNAMRIPFMEEISETLDEINADSTLRAIVVTGTGKVFISGGDLVYMKDVDAQESMRYIDLIMRTTEKMTSSPKVFIAAINGHALGGGCEFTLACDIRIMADRAKIGFPEVTLGMLPGAGGTQRLPRVIGMGRAMEMILTGGVVTAQKALEMGLVTDVVPGEELMAKAEELVEKVKKTAPISIAGAKSCLYQSANMGMDTGFLYERRMWGLCFATQDVSEGIQAYFEKRPPVYTGK